MTAFPEILEKAASLSVGEAAEALARARAASAPMQKIADDPDLLKHLAIGAGVGGAGMGLLGLVRGKKPRSAMRDALGGAMLGGIGGGAYRFKDQIGEAFGKLVASPVEEEAKWKAMHPVTRVAYRAMGWAPPGIPGTIKQELAGGFGGSKMLADVAGDGAITGNVPLDAAKGLVGVVGGAAKYQPWGFTGSLGVGAAHAYRWNQARVAKPIYEARLGLQSMLPAANPADEAAIRAQISYIDKKLSPGLLRKTFGHRGSAHRYRLMEALDPTVFTARQIGEGLAPKLLAGDKSRWGHFLKPRSPWANTAAIVAPTVASWFLNSRSR